ncbi:MAG: DUF4421 family protein [Bacteroidota bacterium]
MKQTIFKIKLLIGLIVIFQSLCFSSVKDTVFFDSIPYILKHDKKISIRPFLQQRFAFIDISKSGLPKISDIQYGPSSRTSIGISGGYKKYILGLSVQLPNDESAIDKYGSTDYTDMQVSLYTRIIGIDTYYQRYKGFYLRNPADFNSAWTDSLPYPQLSNLGLRSLGFNVFYIHKKKFSFIAAFGHTERQLKSAESFLIMFSLRNSELFSTSGIIPDSVAFAYPKLDSLRESNSTLIALSPGYGFTLTHNELFFSMAGFLGIGSQLQNFTFIDNQSFDIKPSFKVNLRGAIGYNGEKQYVGILFNIDTQSISLDNANINIMMYSIRFACGFRI